MRFRREPIAIAADVEAMFHQCFVPPPDQRFLRFLWWADGDYKKDPDVFTMLVHIFEAKSSPSVANFVMKTTAKKNAAEFSEEAVETLLRSFYMDDLLKSTSTVEHAIELVTEMKKLLADGGFNLTKWSSNSKEVIETVPLDERSKSLQNIDLADDTLPEELTLGLQWNVDDDCFGYDMNLAEKPFTRRGILSMTASVYDPLGFISPVPHYKLAQSSGFLPRNGKPN